MKESLTANPAIKSLIEDFLIDLAQANRSLFTRQAYTTDLNRFCAFFSGTIPEVNVEVLRSFLATLSYLSSASRARKQAALSSFFTWAYKHQLIKANPMDFIERIRLDPLHPRGLSRSQVEIILSKIPAKRSRDRLLFRLIFETGLRIGEALSIYIEDLDLISGDEHITVVGKGGQRRTILLDDAGLVLQLRTFLKRSGFRNGPLFRAEKNNRGDALRYQTVQEKWSDYCAKAQIPCTLHQLRHAHPTELINGGVSIGTIRKRLGHKNLQTTLRYAELSDSVDDAELRKWRRQSR